MPCLQIAAGRRRMELSAEEVADIIIYQVGAVKGFCEVEGIRLVSREVPRTPYSKPTDL